MDAMSHDPSFGQEVHHDTSLRRTTRKGGRLQYQSEMNYDTDERRTSTQVNNGLLYKGETSYHTDE